MRRAPAKHLVKQRAKAPPVNAFVVSASFDDLWCQVLWRATERVSFLTLICLSLSYSLLRQTEVGDLQVAIGVKQNVLWFKITVNDSLAMQASDGLNHLRRVETRSLLAKLGILSQVSEQLTTVAKVHDEVKFGVSLERVVQLDDERAIDLLQDMALSCKNDVSNLAYLAS